MDALTQQGKIIKYCEEHGSITIREAFTKLDINSPSKRISEIRNSPFYTVESIVESRIDKHGNKKRWNRYFIRGTKERVNDGC
jgi:hypothetical protein